MAESSLPFSIPPDAAELARHVEFVQRLARRLAADGATSEDLAQETWVATLEHASPLRGALRAWLARVLRNRSALARRSRVRRVRLEAAAARPEALSGTAEIVERMELHGRVVASVLALPEPYREVVVRRYFENESAAEIALTLELPEPTVRTRLARAHERLRQRLAGEFGGDRALCAVALLRLAESGAALVPSSVPSGIPSLALALAMKKALAALVLALLALLAVWTVTREPASARVEPAPAAFAAAEEPAPLTVPEAQPELPAASAPEPAQRAAVLSPEVSAAEEIAPAPEPPAEPSEAWLEFHVRDRHGNPISEAQVRITCYRTREDPGSSHSIDGMPEATSDRAGVARLAYPVRLAWGAPERPEIGELCYEVEHPDFVTLRDWDHSVDENPAQVVLQRGALLIVAGMMGEPAQIVTDVVPHLTDEIRVAHSDWVAVKDGRPSCNRLPPGRHALYLTRAGPGGTWASAVAQFTLADDEVQELTLELLPPRSLLGELDPRVPRPIANGEVLLNLYVGTPGDYTSPKKMRLYGAPVAPDGTFRIEGLPSGRGEMIGMCDGWVSEELDTAGGGENESHYAHQQIDPAAHDEGRPFVLLMKPTARLEFLLLDPDGEPVEAAGIQMWPNVHWSIGYSQIFLERNWFAVSDARGRALIENLPPGDEGLSVQHPELCLPLRVAARGVAERRAEAALLSGQTTELELRLEPCGSDK